eukprot:2026853-Pyramimonas_sp.AAC.1
MDGCLASLTVAFPRLISFFHDRLGLRFALRKLATEANRAALLDRAMAVLGQYAGDAALSIRNLGADFAVGRRPRTATGALK